MKKIWVTISSTMLFFLLVTGPAWANTSTRLAAVIPVQGAAEAAAMTDPVTGSTPAPAAGLETPMGWGMQERAEQVEPEEPEMVLPIPAAGSRSECCS